jgi:hypothetical protein
MRLELIIKNINSEETELIDKNGQIYVWPSSKLPDNKNWQTGDQIYFEIQTKEEKQQTAKEILNTLLGQNT